MAVNNSLWVADFLYFMVVQTDSIRFFRQDELDREKWNRRISSCKTSSVYVTGQYLDVIVKNWGAFVIGDYEAVMPVPIKEKFSFKYVYTPIGVGQLGIIGDSVNAEMESLFIEALHREFSYGRLHLNPSFSSENVQKYGMQMKNNFVLKLNKTYEEIYAAYSKDAKKNLRIASELQPVVGSELPVSELAEAFLFQYGNRGNTGKLSNEYFSFAQSLEVLCQNEMAVKRAIRTREGQLLAAGVFALYNNRIYYVFGAPTDLGRKHRATHLLIDAVIKEYSGRDYVFDFEGSSIPSVMNFYQKFSPENEPYPLYSFNKLPFWIKWFKK